MLGLAYNLANFLRTLALPTAIAQWSMATLREPLVKIGARIVRHGRSIRCLPDGRMGRSYGECRLKVRLNLATTLTAL
jgi:hypothetical protein